MIKEEEEEEDSIVPVLFSWPYDAQSSVLLAGSFNAWQPQPMTPQRDRRWEARLWLHTLQTPHQYKFVVDGQWFFDVRLPTVRDHFGNINNVVDARCVLREEAAFREDVKNAGPHARWMVRSPATIAPTLAIGGDKEVAPFGSVPSDQHFRRCSEEISSALDEACAEGSERSRVGTNLDAVLRWRYVSNELVVDFSLVDVLTGIMSVVRPVGAFPLRVLRPLCICGYSADGEDDYENDDDFLPTLAATNARLATQKRLVECGGSLLQLPDNVLVRVFECLLRRCTCSCHRGEIIAESAVHALCTLELVCRRFCAPRPELSLPEQAAKNMCTGLSGPQLSRRCWKEELLWLDPKTAERENRLKEQLYATAYRRGADGKFANDDVVRATAIAEIKRRWHHWDIALAHASEHLN